MTAQLRLPIDVETACLTCGKAVCRPKKRVGRHTRYCSAECKHAATLRWKATWRAKNYPHWKRDRDGGAG